MFVCVVKGSLARWWDSRAIVTTASRRQRHRPREAHRLSDGRVDAIDDVERYAEVVLSMRSVGIEAEDHRRHRLRQHAANVHVDAAEARGVRPGPAQRRGVQERGHGAK